MVTTIFTEASRFVPQGLDPATNKELTEIWTRVQSRVLALADGDQRKIRPLGVNDVLAHLDAAQKKDNGSSWKLQAVKDSFNKALLLIQTVGGIAAGAASQAFGPSELCFNALNFVIQAWQGYQGIFEELAGLLEKCTEYLGRLEYHVHGGMDAKLSKVACQHLLLFVEICDRTVKLRSRRRKLLAGVKILFLQDNGVTDLLARMESLVDKENRLVVAQTFALASDAAANSKANLTLMQGLVESFAEDRTEQKKERDKQYREKVVLKALAFDETKMNQESSEPEAFWQTIYRNYLRQRVRGTGEWIFSEPKYVAWEKGQAKGPILAIAGGEGTGKSFLTSTIIKRLNQRKTTESSDRRISTGYYFLEGNSREELKNTTNLETVAKSLVWQFSQSERIYLKSVAQICEHYGEIDPTDISKHLIFGNKDLATMNITLYIVIDGLGGTVGEGMVRFLQRASIPMPGRDIRVLVTGDPRCFEQLSKAGNILFDCIPISTYNRSDVEKFIENRMDRMPALIDRARLGISELRDNIRHRLCVETKGDYFKIDRTLDHISSLEYKTDIQQALDDASKERSQQITEEIEKLNESRSEKELLEINEIVRWIVYGKDLLTPKQMSAALYVRSGEPSLLPLEQKIKIKYPLFEVDRNGKVDFRSSEIERYIPLRHTAHDLEDSQGKQAAQAAEVAMVKHFLLTVCPSEVYTKLKFDAYLAQLLRPKGSRIYRDDLHTGEAMMALTCLDVLTEETDRKRTRLLTYARKYLISHLLTVDLALADIACKRAVGIRLAKLFTGGSSIDILLHCAESVDDPTLRFKIRRYWLYSDDSVNTILRWLGDSAVTSEISDTAMQAWVANVTSGTEPEEDLMRPAAKRMAVHFLQEAHSESFTKDAFLFIAGFVNKIERRKGIATHNVNDPSYIYSIEEIDNVENWCQMILDVKSKTSLWHVQMGNLLEVLGLPRLAEARARQALMLDPHDWRASYLLAKLVGTKEGIEILAAPIRERLASDNAWRRDPIQRVGFAKLLYMCGLLYWEDKCPSTAITYCKMAMELDPTNYDRVTMVLSSLATEGRWQDIIVSLKGVKNSAHVSQGLPEMAIELWNADRFHQIFLQAALRTKHFDFLAETYETAISLLEDRQDRATLCYIRYYYATAIYSLRDRESKAIAEWEKVLADVPQSHLYTILPLLINKLGPLYLHKAQTSGHDTEAASSYLQKLENLVPDGAPGSEALLPPKLYLARYYQTQGDVLRAKQITREIVKQALEILSDDDEDNDKYAYLSLLTVFLPLEDSRNMLTSLAMMSLNTSDTAIIYCDGDCGNSWSYLGEMLWCRDCIDFHVDKECHQKLCDDTFPFTACHKSHDFLHIPARESIIRDVPVGCVPFGEAVIPLNEWTERIRKNYVYIEH
ncbi:hypothetical protein ABOM_003378 [Aspergillus bombycis]|uniref:C2H2-type domain-containing protein n=1 Tax=Aspergillus bombycis TaxID=109264 RepID=A0A1F8AAK9_9EURO|nr:hypothetical protein ABOM_003378 [Aspergillus bombycis]OGM48435.1 hypothetical protein ABOM_003378 [Aspergillus bombycis]